MGLNTKAMRQEPATVLQHKAGYLTPRTRPQHGLNLKVLKQFTPADEQGRDGVAIVMAND